MCPLFKIKKKKKMGRSGPGGWASTEIFVNTPQPRKNKPIPTHRRTAAVYLLNIGIYILLYSLPGTWVSFIVNPRHGNPMFYFFCFCVFLLFILMGMLCLRAVYVRPFGWRPATTVHPCTGGTMHLYSPSAGGQCLDQRCTVTIDSAHHSDGPPRCHYPKKICRA